MGSGPVVDLVWYEIWRKAKKKKEGSEPVVDLVCYMILYEFDKKKMGFHANSGFGLLYDSIWIW